MWVYAHYANPSENENFTLAFFNGHLFAKLHFSMLREYNTYQTSLANICDAMW